MKLRFLIPVFALFFILSCGDDPVSSEFNDEDQQTIKNDENVLPDDENSENGNDSERDTDTDSGKTDDNADSTDDPGDSQPDKDTDNADSADDSENNTPDDNDTTADDDADTSDPVSDHDEQEDQDDPTSDEDDVTDDDGEQNDADQDSGEEPEDEYDFEVVLPYNGETVDKTIDFGTAVRKIDVLLMVDLSGLITAAHDNLKENVKTAIIDRIRAEIPDSAFGLVTFGTIEQKNPYTLAQPVSTDPNDVRNAVNGITQVTSGSTTYHNLALWEAATGEYNYEQIAYENNIGGTSYDRSITIQAVDCSGEEGNIGGACFRENAMPVFVMASAKAFIDLTKTYSWTNGGSKMKTKAKAVEEMNSIHAKFIGFSLDGTSSSTKPTNDFKYIADGTKSNYLSGDNFNVIINADDSALSYQIAEAVKNLTENIRLDVKAEFKHVGNDYGVENTAQFKKSFYPEAGNTVKAGNTASFDITFGNTIHENNDCDPHIFYITVEAVGEGLVLDSRKIKVIVPGKNCPDPLK